MGEWEAKVDVCGWDVKRGSVNYKAKEGTKDKWSSWFSRAEGRLGESYVM